MHPILIMLVILLAGVDITLVVVCVALERKIKDLRKQLNPVHTVMDRGIWE